MRKKILFKALIIFLSIYSSSYPQKINLAGRWLFKLGDSSNYKNISINENNWDSINVPGNWESQGYPGYDGFAWYRLHFRVDKRFLNRQLYLLAGQIDDADETFLNGMLIGKTGHFPPDAVSEWNQQRIYSVPKGLLREENVLAVRVYDMQLEGGIKNGILGIYSKENYVKELNLGPAPKKSFYRLVTSNGIIAAVYNEKADMIENIFPHIFQYYDKGKIVEPFIKNLKLRTNLKPLTVNYLQNTHVINVRYKNFSLMYFAPFTGPQRIFYAVLEGKFHLIKNLNFEYQNGYCPILKRAFAEDTLKGVSKKYFLFSFNDSLENNLPEIDSATSKVKNKDIVSDELRFMKAIFARSVIPHGLSDGEINLYQQSISILKMAQVSQKEIFKKSRGQILASLPPGGWNIGWLRDGTYSILALNRLGLFKEAKYALSFFLNADAGYYKHYIYKDGIDYGVKTDYKLSVCRYFGTGKEESDFNDDGPNIELDGFGLYLIAFSDYINRSGDKQFLNDNYKVLSGLVADPIITFIDKNNLIRKESGPWETHLPGEQYAFTSIVSSAGLKDFGDLCKKFNYSGYEKYIRASEQIKNGIKGNLIYQGKLIKGFFPAASPKTLGFFDGGTIEAFNYNVLSGEKLFRTYFSAYKRGLKINGRRGFSRLNNPDWYTIGEWPFINLRFASALVKYGFKKDALNLLNRTTHYSNMNFNLIAELYNFKTENYDGAVPMVGFGAATYILTFSDYFSESKK